MIHQQWCDTDQHTDREDGADPGGCQLASSVQTSVGIAQVWLATEDGRTVMGQDTPWPIEPREYRLIAAEGLRLAALADPQPGVPAQSRGPQDESAGEHGRPRHEPGQDGTASAP